MRASVDQQIRTAIRDLRVVSFTLRGLERRAEPHDYGVLNGVEKLFFYQIGGSSRSGPPIGWRWAVVADIENLAVLEQQFPGVRTVPSARHTNWDVLYASVRSHSG